MPNSNNNYQIAELCKYKDVFGKPNEGVHKYRIFGIAIVDAVFTIVFVYLFTYYSKYSFWPTLAFTFFLGIFMHRLFCVRTTLDKMLFPDDNKK